MFLLQSPRAAECAARRLVVVSVFFLVHSFRGRSGRFRLLPVSEVHLVDELESFVWAVAIPGFSGTAAR